MTDLDEVQAIIAGSGNSFHCRVLEHLRGKGWFSIVSPYYTDNLTSKPREIDLVSEKATKFGQPSFRGTLNVKLLIECKYIPQKIVFWFDEQDIASTIDWLADNTPIKRTSHLVNDHHFLSGDRKVAKLFGSKNKPNLENEVIYKALNQSLNAMVYHSRLGSIIPEGPNGRSGKLVQVQYPVIVCNSFQNFWAVEMNDQKNLQQIVKNFQLEVNYAYVMPDGTQKSEYFLVDVVDFRRIDEFLESLDKEAELMILEIPR